MEKVYYLSRMFLNILLTEFGVGPPYRTGAGGIDRFRREPPR